MYSIDWLEKAPSMNSMVSFPTHAMAGASG